MPASPIQWLPASTGLDGGPRNLEGLLTLILCSATHNSQGLILKP